MAKTSLVEEEVTERVGINYDHLNGGEVVNIETLIENLLNLQNNGYEYLTFIIDIHEDEYINDIKIYSQRPETDSEKAKRLAKEAKWKERAKKDKIKNKQKEYKLYLKLKDKYGGIKPPTIDLSKGM